MLTCACERGGMLMECVSAVAGLIMAGGWGCEDFEMPAWYGAGGEFDKVRPRKKGEQESKHSNVLWAVMPMSTCSSRSMSRFHSLCRAAVAVPV